MPAGGMGDRADGARGHPLDERAITDPAW